MSIKMKRIYGALSPFDKKTICPTWQELRAEIQKFKTSANDEYGPIDKEEIEVYQLRFRQMKSVVLRKGLIERIDKKLPSGLAKLDRDGLYKDIREQAKHEYFMYLLEARLNKKYDLSRVGGSYYDILFYGYLGTDRELFMLLDTTYVYSLSEVTSSYLSRHVSRKTYNKLVRDNRVTNSAMEVGNYLPIDYIHRELNKDPQKTKDAEEIAIVINSRMSWPKLIKSIERKRPQIEKMIDKLPVPEEDALLPSIRDLRIVELRDSSDKSYKQIANIISNEFELDDPDAKINEDSIKTSYHRTHKQLTKLIPEK